MKIFFGTFWLLGFMALAQGSLAAPAQLTYQGRIVTSAGIPLEAPNVAFNFTITSPSGTCILYREQLNNVDMRNSAGVFDTPIGVGSRTFPNLGTVGLLEVFSNSEQLQCEGGSTYTPGADDGRKLRVQFFDGQGWNLISPDNVIRTVPFAAQASNSIRLGGKEISQFILHSQIPQCGAGEVLTTDAGGVLKCTPDTGGAAGTVNSITGTGGVSASHDGAGAYTVSVASNGITTAKINDTAVTAGKIADSAVTSAKILDATITVADFAPGGGAGQVYRYSGTEWITTKLLYSDLLNSFGSSPWPASCPSGQFVSWSSASDAFSCSAISSTQIVTSLGFTPANQARTVSAGSGLMLDGVAGATQDLSANRTFAVDVGTGAHQIPQLDASGKLNSSVLPTSFADGIWSSGGGDVWRLTGNVGIGTDSPAVALDVVGKINASQLCIGTDCRSAWPATASTGVTAVTAGSGLLVGATSGATISATGTLNIDVGTTTGKIVQVAASNKLPSLDGSDLTGLTFTQITGTVPIAKGGTGQTAKDAAFNALAPLTTKGDLIVSNGTSSLRLPAGADGKVLKADSNEALGLIWGDAVATEIASMVSNGIVQRNGAGSYGAVTVASPLTYTGGTLGMNAGNGGVVLNGGNTVTTSMTLGTNSGHALGIKTSGTERLTIDLNGKIGIGTTSPEKLLHIDNGASAGGVQTIVQVGAGTNPLFLTHNAPFVSGNMYFDSGWKYYSSKPASSLGLGNGIDFFVAPPGTAGGNVTTSLAMRVTAAGNVGIGVSDPDASQVRFRVDAGSAINGISATTSANSSNTIVAHNSGGSNGVGIYGVAHNAASHPGYFTNSALGTACSIGSSSGGPTCSSDRRLKRNIASIPYALEKINALNGVTFHWKKAQQDKEHLGVIAQEVQKVFPQAVGTNKDGYLSVDYSVLVSPLIEAVKELSRENMKKEQEIQDLKARLLLIEQRLEISK